MGYCIKYAVRNKSKRREWQQERQLMVDCHLAITQLGKSKSLNHRKLLAENFSYNFDLNFMKSIFKNVFECNKLNFSSYLQIIL